MTRLLYRMTNNLKFATFIAICFVMGSCGEESEPHVARDSGVAQDMSQDASEPDRSAVWICHHPETKFHDQACIDGIFPAGCYIENDSSRYCWLLTQADCADAGMEKEWYKYCEAL